MAAKPFKILMTGATGFLGSNLLRKFLAEKRDVCLLVRSASNYSRIKDLVPKLKLFSIDEISLERFFKAEKIDVILHCATNYGRKMEPPVSVLQANLLLEHGLNCFINSDTILDKRVSHYSLSKSQFREWLNLYSDRVVCGNVALEHFYGPGDDNSKFVTLMIQSLLRGVPSIGLTPGEQKRDFIHISDVVNAFSTVVEWLKRKKAGFYNFEIGTGSTISIRDFMCLLKELTGNTVTKLDFGAFPYRENEVMESNVDLSLIRAAGWRPKMPLARGLRGAILSEKERILK